MNEVKGQEVRTSSMVPGADARYLTYGRLNGRFEYNKNIYHGKWERYSDGTSRLVKYVEPRVKPSALLSSSNSGNGGFVENDEDYAERYEQGVQQRIYKIKNVLRGYIRNNDFDHFWTITFDPKEVGTDNLVRYQAMEKWLGKERKKAKRQGLDFRYIFVPEYHTGKGGNSGTIHWHGVTGGYLPKLTDSGKNYKGVKVYNCDTWELGFTNVQKVRSKTKVASYVMKYITKNLVTSPVGKGKKRYWASKNLSTPEKMYLMKNLEIGRVANATFDHCEIYELTKEETEKIMKEEERND